MMDKQILASKLVDMATNRYAVAVLKDGKNTLCYLSFSKIKYGVIPNITTTDCIVEML